jgi:hypothetical protein
MENRLEGDGAESEVRRSTGHHVLRFNFMEGVTCQIEPLISPMK